MTSNTVIGGAGVDPLDLLHRGDQPVVRHQVPAMRMRSLKRTRCGDV